MRKYLPRLPLSVDLPNVEEGDLAEVAYRVLQFSSDSSPGKPVVELLEHQGETSPGFVLSAVTLDEPEVLLRDLDRLSCPCSGLVREHIVLREKLVLDRGVEGHHLFLLDSECLPVQAEKFEELAHSPVGSFRSSTGFQAGIQQGSVAQLIQGAQPTELLDILAQQAQGSL